MNRDNSGEKKVCTIRHTQVYSDASKDKLMSHAYVVEVEVRDFKNLNI